MTLICAGVAAGTEIEAALAPLTTDGTLTVTVREVPQEHAHPGAGPTGAPRHLRAVQR
jgi:glycine cleavage system transcriptional repressor